MADVSPNKEGLCSAGVDTFVQKTSSFSDNTRSWAWCSGDAHSFCSLWCRDKNAAVFLMAQVDPQVLQPAQPPPPPVVVGGTTAALELLNQLFAAVPKGGCVEHL